MNNNENSPKSSSETNRISNEVNIRRGLSRQEIFALLEKEEIDEYEPGQNLGVFLPINTFT